MKKGIRLVSGTLVIALLISGLFVSTGTEEVVGIPSVDTVNADSPTSSKANGNYQINEGDIPVETTTPVSITTAKISPIKKQIYSGKPKKPAVKLTDSGKTLVKDKDYKLTYKDNKNPGKATIEINGIGNYFGTMEVKFRIIIKVPKKVKLSNNQKNITVSWKKVPAVTGYKVYFASNRDFTKKKSVKTIKSRKKTTCSIPTPIYKRTYYVKVRAYKIIKGTTYYSKSSKIKKIKTKNQKWIEVDLSQQKTYLKKGKKTIKTYVVSTGKKKTPTIKGTFHIYKKNPKHDMVGRWNPEKNAPEYVQPDVLWTSYFKDGYAFHAAYWHNNFGQPMSHGCVNMRTKEAKYLYKWAPIGTKVVVHK